MFSKGLSNTPRGEDRASAKLKADQVLEIRSLWATGNHTQKELGMRFGIAKNTITTITKRNTWKHI
jgi:DNA-binding MarR family transcriptional regulator